jgi:hypothetical protein
LCKELALIETEEKLSQDQDALTPLDTQNSLLMHSAPQMTEHVRQPSVPAFVGEPANPYAALPLRPYTQNYAGMEGSSRENLVENAAPLGGNVLRGGSPPQTRSVLGFDGRYRGAGR